MVVLGVTGGVGTGKSTVSRMFRSLGAVVLDADALAHCVTEPKQPAWRKIVRAFGRSVLNPDQTVTGTRSDTDSLNVGRPTPGDSRGFLIRYRA